MLSAFVRLRGEKTCLCDLHGKDREKGEVVIAFVLNACEAADHGIILFHRSVFFQRHKEPSKTAKSKSGVPM
jgi:hypothetical protein